MVPRFCAGCPCGHRARHRRPCGWPCAQRRFLEFFAARNSPRYLRRILAFPLPNRIPSPRKFGILLSKRTPPSSPHEPSRVHYFRTMTDANLTSWIDVPAGHDFPLANLPFGMFSTADRDARPGMRLGDHVIDLSALFHAAGLLGRPRPSADVLSAPVLNPLMKLGKPTTVALRERVQALFALRLGRAPGPPRPSRVVPCSRLVCHHAHAGGSGRLHGLLFQRGPRPKRGQDVP